MFAQTKCIPFVFFLLSLTVVRKVQAKSLSCPGDCSGQGLCNADNTRCDCFSGYTGHDCGLRTCPQGLQWLGYAAGNEDLHATMAECSNAGDCDRSSGYCKCAAPYSGNACQIIGCPPYGQIDCKGNGKCMSLKDVGPHKDDLQFTETATYNLWDAERIFGCVCDYGYQGHDCSERTCAWGDDPLDRVYQDLSVTSSRPIEEVQTYTCAGTSGTVVMKIFGFVTTSIAFNANAATVKAALEAIPAIIGVNVGYNTGSALCAANGGPGIVSTFTWTHLPGDVPTLTFPTNGPSIGITSSSTSLLTREECSGRGKCSRSGDTAGLCVCESVVGLFKSSDGTSAGLAGGTGDCGVITTSPSTCTYGSSASTLTVCSGHGKSKTTTRKKLLFQTERTERTERIERIERTNIFLLFYFSVVLFFCSLSLFSLAFSLFFLPSTLPTLLYNFPGTCNTAAFGASGHKKCDCDENYQGYDCGERMCPKGKSWWSDPTATNVAHAWTECSGRGTCDRSTGVCKCDSGATGASCSRTECPYVSSSSATIECNGRGRCMTTKTFNTYREVNGIDSALTYGADPGAMDTWDADSFQQCLCDDNRYVNNQYSWVGIDCAFRTCPRGDDPETATSASGYHLKEIQKITCIATGGTFTLGFRDLTTVAIDFDANANGTNTTMAGTGTVTYGSATLVTTSDLSSKFVAGDFVILVHNTDSSQVRQYTVASDSSSTIVMTEPIGMTSGTFYTILKVTTSIESALEALTVIDDVSVNIESGAAICTEKRAVSQSVAANAVQTTITHAAFSRALVVGEVVTVSGHLLSSGTAAAKTANLAMNQVYEVKTVTSTTITILTGSGMTAATYNAGTIIVSLPEAREFALFSLLIYCDFFSNFFDVSFKFFAHTCFIFFSTCFFSH